MKKILLVTTALVSLSAPSLFAADAPTVGLGGVVTFQTGMSDQSEQYSRDDSTNESYRKSNMSNRSEVFVKVDGKADNGLAYGAQAGLDTKAYDKNSHRTFVYLEGLFGRVELGSNDSADDQMKVDASSIARATGGVDGDWDKYVSTVNYSNSQDLNNANTYGFLTSPDLYINQNIVTGSSPEALRKISFFTPRMNGFQFGVSYSMDSNNSGEDTTSLQVKKGSNIENIYSGGINYSAQMEGIDVNASLLGEMGGAEDTTKKDLRTYSAGLSLGMEGVTVAGSYANYGKSLMSKSTSGLKGGSIWTAGVAYVQGPVGTSLTYLESKNNKNSFKNVSVGVDYMLAPGLLPYAEFTNYRYKPAHTTGYAKNTGTVFMIGTQLNF